jgi:transposase
VVAKKAGHALHVLDRFHIMVHLNKAIDKVRAQEARALKAQGRAPVLTRTRWLLLKRPDHLTATERPRLIDLVRHNLRAVRSYLLREEFQYFWTYKSVTYAGRFLDRWCTRALRSRIPPMQQVARMLRRHRPLLLNYFRAKRELSAAAVEGFNNKARVTTRTPKGTGSGPTTSWKSRSITPLAPYRSRKFPTDSADEAFFEAPGRRRK